MGSAILTFMVFLGSMLILRSLIFGIIPTLMEKRRKKEEERSDPSDEKE